MDEKETFTQKTLKSLRTHDGSERRTRKRKLSRIILFVDAIVVVLILIFFQTRTPEEHNRSATINYKDMQIRFSITNQKESGIYLYSITLKSTSKKQTVYTFDKSIAQLRIFHKNNTVITKTIGNDLVRLNL
ncbi:MAG: hypothetical protein GY754_30840, partial [bacterium]|nr:hypothetical protein [bacterium]